MINASPRPTPLMKRIGLLSVLVAVLALGAAPTAQAACSDTLSQPFLKWNDRATYTLAPGGSMESSAGWSLSGGASMVAGNEPWHVNGAADSRSLRLPAGSKATSAFMCVGKGYPFMRLFVRNTGSSLSKLKVEVLYKDPETGAVKALPTGNLRTSDSGWQLTRRIAMAIGHVATSADGTGRVAFRISPVDGYGNWQADDLFVDPCRR